MAAVIELPAQQLPADQSQQQQILGRYFQRQHCAVESVDNGWRVKTRWATQSEYYIDPDLSRGLDCWPGKVSVASIPLAVHQDQGFLVGLNDCWSLLSWSCQLKQWLAANQLPKKINLLHLDSHTDLNSPRLSYEKGDWKDLLNQQVFDVLNPATVAASISSGAIGIGSFIVPLLSVGIPLNIYHLSPTRHLRYAPDEYSMCLELHQGDPLFPDAQRPEIRINHSSSPSSYISSDQQGEILAAVDRRYPVFLHIDLDYFNNRYDGRPDWAGQDQPHDPDTVAVLEAIDHWFDDLSGRGLDIVDISVGISPGFFPATLWSEALERVRRGIARC